MYQQSPHTFEFNEKFLLEILEALFSCQFGTFLYDRDHERQNLKEKTHSLWSYINSNMSEFLNPHYARKPNSLQRRDCLFFPLSELRHLRIWEKCYLKYAKRLPRGGYDTYCHSLCSIQVEPNSSTLDELKLVNTPPSVEENIASLQQKKQEAIENEQFLLAHKYKLQIEELIKEQKSRLWTPSSPKMNTPGSRKAQSFFRQQETEK